MEEVALVEVSHSHIVPQTTFHLFSMTLKINMQLVKLDIYHYKKQQSGLEIERPKEGENTQYFSRGNIRNVGIPNKGC